ncbi:hypothetical protein, partial [Parasphingorhabdus sp.]|uniref:hypothetical protein n=1 Tax=Parasphingorhabdus sp. TaxID=2709688 RepID=UPI0030B24F37
MTIPSLRHCEERSDAAIQLGLIFLPAAQRWGIRRMVEGAAGLGADPRYQAPSQRAFLAAPALLSRHLLIPSPIASRQGEYWGLQHPFLHIPRYAIFQSGSLKIKPCLPISAEAEREWLSLSDTFLF